jgi:FtsP/CotA-like multicopper oxidase with cupredoxin domain
MGSTFTYYYNIVEPGTYMYHCHVEATEHMQMGMLGNLYVEPRQNGTEYTFEGRKYTKFAYNDGDGSTGYDVDYPVQMGSFDPNFHDQHLNVQPLPFAAMTDKYPMLNGRGYPDTVNPAVMSTDTDLGPRASQPVHSLISAKAGERILLRISNLAVTRLYTLASTLPMQVVGQSARLLRGPGVNGAPGKNLYYRTNSVTLGGGESADVIVDTKGLTPGKYAIYTTNLKYLSNDKQDFGGMMTEIHIQ